MTNELDTFCSSLEAYLVSFACPKVVINCDGFPKASIFKDKLTVEYALRRCTSPIGVASYETLIMEELPKELKSSLPTVEALEAELAKQEILSSEEANIAKKKRGKRS